MIYAFNCFDFVSLMRRRPPKRLADEKNRNGLVNESLRAYDRGREPSGPGDGEVVVGVAGTLIEEILEPPAPLQDGAAVTGIETLPRVAI